MTAGCRKLRRPSPIRTRQATRIESGDLISISRAGSSVLLELEQPMTRQPANATHQAAPNNPRGARVEPPRARFIPVSRSIGRQRVELHLDQRAQRLRTGLA